MNNWYKTFIVLSECRSYTETAKRLYCSQPTVTQHIKQLERSLECTLIQRNKRKIELTNKGEIVLKHAQMICHYEEKMMDAIRQSESEEKVSLYLSTYIANHYFEEIFGSHFNDEKLSYEINCYCYNELKNLLFEKKIKFAIMPIYELDPILLQQFDVEMLFREELHLAVSPMHPLAERQILYGRDLEDYEIYVPQGEFYTQAIKMSLQQKNIIPNYSKMSNFTVIAKALHLQSGMAFLPPKVIEQEGLLFKPVKGLSIRRMMTIVKQKNVVLSTSEQAICEHIKECIGTPVS
ncbi:LysR family transcriptional regulator [Solibacillus sp. FSL H8-0523]|uniref:LysR family transcriptional regulator n=1 Tax=Solibacillus sp. FSL H8-0523 TaxID=2954511 RepID=UPI0031014108